VVAGAAKAASTAMTGLATALTTFTAKPLLLQNLNVKQAMFTAATVASPKLSDTARPRRKRPVPAERRLVSETLEFNGVVVLGCMCRRLPLSPNPDEGLDW
jgi:hypothetical protein